MKLETQKPAQLKKGRILRVKEGYNPNSSSIGSVVFSIPSMVTFSTLAFSAFASLIFNKYLKNDNRKKNVKDKKDTK